jgi:hypothetical protein
VPVPDLGSDELDVRAINVATVNINGSTGQRRRITPYRGR